MAFRFPQLPVPMVQQLSVGENLLVGSGKGPTVLTILGSFTSQVPQCHRKNTLEAHRLSDGPPLGIIGQP